MRYIQLTQGKRAVVDDDDYEWLNRYKWCTTSGYAISWVDGRMTLMHRLILEPAPDMQVDHINRDRLDNRRANLRIVTHAQNRVNVGRYKNNKSGYKGVIEAKAPRLITPRWRAYLRHNGKTITIGNFASPLEAARAYDYAAAREFGEYAVLNGA